MKLRMKLRLLQFELNKQTNLIIVEQQNPIKKDDQRLIDLQLHWHNDKFYPRTILFHKGELPF